MQDAQNTTVVRDAYAAFLRQDIPGLLATFDDQIVWKPVTGAASHVPMKGERHGLPAVAEYFDIVSARVRFSRFEPQQFIAQGDTVVVLGHYAGQTSTGGSFDSDFAMVFTLRNGRIAAFQEFLDSAALNAAFTPAGVAS